MTVISERKMDKPEKEYTFCPENMFECPWCGEVSADSDTWEYDQGVVNECPKCKKPSELSDVYITKNFKWRPIEE
jgi:predicted RNA-binding Zn-ribbon protein involved in translation (DUF1610 family)